MLFIITQMVRLNIPITIKVIIRLVFGHFLTVMKSHIHIKQSMLKLKMLMEIIAIKAIIGLTVLRR